MINSITILNLISTLFLLCSLLVIIFSGKKSKQGHNFLYVIVVLILLTVTITNLLEHTNITNQFDKYEDIVEVIFFPIFIFALFSTVINKELNKRKVSESKLNVIFNQSFTFIGLLDRDGNLIEANNTALNFINKELESVVNKKFWDTPWWQHSDKEREKLITAFNKAIKGETIKIETTHKSPNGEFVYVDFSLTPIFDNDSNVKFILPEGRDISKIKEAEEKLITLNQKLEQVIKERTDELETTLEEHKTVNEELYIKNEELATINDQLKEKQSLIEVLLNEKEIKNKELSNTNTELETTLLSLQEAQSQLIHSEKMSSLGVLTAGIAHELNNPINFISSGIMGLKKCIGNISNAYKQVYDIIISSSNKTLIDAFNITIEKNKVEHNFSGINTLSSNISDGVYRATDIIKSLRSFVHTNNDLISETDITKIISDVLKMLFHEYKNRIEITHEYESSIIINCRPGKINQLIMNLLSNAIQAIEDKGEIKIKITKSLKNIKLVISDSGIGMSDETARKIFDPFFTTKPLGKGTGLGLSISYNIIQEHKGNIKVNSKINKGSEFILTLPIN